MIKLIYFLKIIQTKLKIVAFLLQLTHSIQSSNFLLSIQWLTLLLCLLLIPVYPAFIALLGVINSNHHFTAFRWVNVHQRFRFIVNLYVFQLLFYLLLFINLNASLTLWMVVTVANRIASWFRSYFAQFKLQIIFIYAVAPVIHRYLLLQRLIIFYWQQPL